MPIANFPRTSADLASAAELAEMDGLEIVQRMADGRLPAAPIAQAACLVISGVAPGEVVFEGTPNFTHYNPQGTVHGGWFGTALDSAMGCAVMSRLPKGKSYTTLEYKVNMIRPAFEDTGTLRITGRVTHVGGRTAIAEGVIEDANGKVFATASTTCLVLDLPRPG